MEILAFISAFSVGWTILVHREFRVEFGDTAAVAMVRNV